MYKIKLIRKDFNTQIEKKIYETTNKFNKYGKEYFIRKNNNSYNCMRAEAYCKIYKLNSNEKWEEIEIPIDFENIGE